MNPNGNGAGYSSNGKNGNGKPPPATATVRCPRRVVLLAAGEHEAVSEVLFEMSAAEVSGRRLHTEVQRLAGEHAGTVVAAEWLSNLGWTRFLWCRK